MTENQKLREALQHAIEDLSSATGFLTGRSRERQSKTVEALAKLQADIAMPTADHLPDAGEMVVDHFPDATKMIETAAPVGERLTLSAEDVHAAFVKHFPKTRISQAWIGFAAEIAEAMQARAALIAGDAVDAQRYRWLRDESWAGYNQCKGFPHVFTVDGAGNRRTMLAEEALDVAIDAAIAARAKGGAA